MSPRRFFDSLDLPTTSRPSNCPSIMATQHSAIFKRSRRALADSASSSSAFRAKSVEQILRVAIYQKFVGLPINPTTSLIKQNRISVGLIRISVGLIGIIFRVIRKALRILKPHRLLNIFRQMESYRNYWNDWIFMPSGNYWPPINCDP